MTQEQELADLTQNTIDQLEESFSNLIESTNARHDAFKNEINASMDRFSASLDEFRKAVYEATD